MGLNEDLVLAIIYHGLAAIGAMAVVSSTAVVVVCVGYSLYEKYIVKRGLEDDSNC